MIQYAWRTRSQRTRPLPWGVEKFNPLRRSKSIKARSHLLSAALLAQCVLACLPSPAEARDSVVVFNEVHYHPANDDSSLEYIELYNQFAVEVDISNWRLDGDIEFDFPEGTIIPGRSYLVIARNPSALAAATGTSGALGPYNGSLSNSGNTVTLYNNNRSFRSQAGAGSTGLATDELEGRRIMDELEYRDEHPWPPGADGSGFTLAKRDPDTGTAHPENWTVSSQVNGTPGSANDFPALPTLAFNEVTSSLDQDFRIELHNHGTGSIALEGLVIASSDANAPDHTFPAGDLAGGGFLTVDGATLGFTPEDNRLLFLFGVGKNTLIDTVRVDDSPIARAPDGIGRWSRPTSPTPGSANEVSVEDGIVINEIFYHAKPQVESGKNDTTSLQVLDYGSTWRYNLSAGVNGLPAGWASSAHAVDNVNWASGPGLLGFEGATLGEPIRTSISMSAKISYYFETEFDYNDPEAVTEIVIRHYIDDGAVFYLNGVEIGRFNMDPGSVTPTTIANPGVGNATLQTLVISNPNILQGSNRLSVEVHQRSTGSSDIVFGANVSLTQQAGGNHIPYAERDEEWIELYNRSGSAIDLTGWELSGGISYQFDPATSIPAGGYLVIARDASSLLANHPGIPVVGDYSGKLGNGGDLIVLADANGNVADEVRYFDSGKWHPEADGGGSSLELRDPDADNANAGAWAPSDESARNHWQTYTYEAIADDDGIGLDSYHELQVGLLDAGEFLIDDVSVIENGSLEFIQNGDFEGDAPGATADKWRAIGTHGSHGRTVVITDPDDPGNQCLHVVATGPTENKHNKIETTFANSEQVVVGNTYRISFRAKWLSGSSLLNTKLYFNYLQRTHALDSAETWGTPGTVNTAAIPNAGPDLSGLTHSPVVPDAAEAVTVGIDANDPDGIDDLTLFYSVDGGAYQATPMTAAGERYTGTIPGQGAGAIVRFYVRGSDDDSAISHYPAAAADGGAFYQVQDGLADTSGLRHNFRIIIAESDRAFLFLNTNRMSNDRIPATVIEDEETVYHDVRLRLKASAAGRYRNSNYGFNIRFQPDRLFRGVHDSLSVERGQTTNEILSKTLMNRAGGGYWSFYDDVAFIIPPTSGHQGVGLLSLSRHTGRYWDSFFPGSEEKGTLFNLELHYAPTTTTGGPEGLKIGNPYTLTRGRYRLEDRGNDKEPYRWGFQIRSARDRDDYSRIIALNQAVGNLSGSALKEALDSIIDVNQWMRTFAMMSLNGTTDTYGRVHEHNFRFFVRPTDGKIIVMQWDLDSAFRLGTTASVIPTVNRDGTPYAVAKLFSVPEYRRIFDGHLDDLIETTFNSDYVTSISGGLTAAIGANTNFSGYITNRANYIRTTLPVAVPFGIATNGGNDFSENDSTVDLSGSGSYEVFSIEVNGVPTPVTWTGSDTWQITVPLDLGPNALTLTARNHQGAEIGSDTITVTNTTAPILITELIAHTDLPEVDSIELHNPNPVTVYIGGWYLTDNQSIPRKFRIPNGTTIAPGGYLVFDESDFSVGPEAFRLSEYGEDAYLFRADPGGELTGYSHGWDFRASPNGVTTGLYTDSQGKEHFVLQAANTLRAANSLPLVGPIVISEIHYHPSDRGGGVDNRDDEFIELTNISPAPVPLYSTDTSVPGYGNAALNDTWRLRNAVDFDFPAGVEMEPGETILVVGFDPATEPAQLASLRAKFSIPDSVRIFGPWSGKLNNSGEEIELKFPGSADAEVDFFVPYYTLEEIDYRDSAPWPAEADGGGLSLHRLRFDEFANDPINWKADTPWRATNVAPPDDVAATDGFYDDKVRIDWIGVTEALEYVIYRNDTAGPDGAVEIGRVAAGTLQFDDTTATPGRPYFYAVTAAMPENRETALSDWQEGEHSTETTYRPDGLIGTRASSKRGNAVYNRSGAGQTVTTRSKRRKKLKFFLALQNDGVNADVITVRATKGNRTFSAKYFEKPPGGARRNVTGAAVSGNHRVNLSGSGQVAIDLETKRKGRKTRGMKGKSFLVTGSSRHAPERTDAVKGKAKSG